jgi:hypothetical protein
MSLTVNVAAELSWLELEVFSYPSQACAAVVAK